MRELLAAFVTQLADILSIIGFFRGSAQHARRLSWSVEKSRSLRIRERADGCEVIEKRTKKRRLDLG